MALKSILKSLSLADDIPVNDGSRVYQVNLSMINEDEAIITDRGILCTVKTTRKTVLMIQERARYGRCFNGVWNTHL